MPGPPNARMSFAGALRFSKGSRGELFRAGRAGSSSEGVLSAYAFPGWVGPLVRDA
jgi:hypothetical protein